MSKTTNVFSEAIAEAKQIRQTAIENAKKALEESMTPKLQRMISQRLQEMEGEEEINENEELEETIDLDEVEETEDSESEASEETEPAEDPKISSLTVSELTQIIKDIITSDDGVDSLDDSTEEMGGELNSDELPADDMVNDEEVGDDVSGDDEEIDLDELMSGLDSLDEVEEELDESKVKGTSHQKGGTYKLTPGFKKVGVSKMHENKIKTLQKELNEVNLLNSKLLYVNKIFKANQLSENQKLRVIEKFDNLTNVKSVKLMFENLSNSFNKQKPNLRKQIKENLGFASKPILGTSSKSKTIIEDASITRMKKLAGIK